MNRYTPRMPRAITASPSSSGVNQHRWYKRMGREHFDCCTNPSNAKKVQKGDTVRVVRGRKVPKGTEGVLLSLHQVRQLVLHEVRRQRRGLSIQVLRPAVQVAETGRRKSRPRGWEVTI